MKKLLLILFIFGCENTITDSPENDDYGVIINEINYNSSSDLNAEDWIELYNPTNETILIEFWEFKDSNDDNVFILPENAVLIPGGYLVLCENLNEFSQIFPDVSSLIGDFEFGLEGAGEKIRLFDSNQSLVDEVEYDDESPWPLEPDGTGPTLELIDSSTDNNLGENWATSNNNGGTPGQTNSVTNE